MTLLRVNVGGLDFFGHRGPFAIGKDGFTGWDDADYRMDSAARTNSHGAFPAPAYREPRTVNLAGHVVAASAAQLGYFADQFNGILAEGELAKVTVERPWGARWAPDASVMSRKFVEVGGLSRGTFTLALRLPDAIKYGEEREVPAAQGVGARVFHRGNARAWPVLTVTGSMPGGYEVSVGDRLVEVFAPLVAGKPHVINMRTGRLTVGGDRVYGVFGYSEWLYVEPGLPQDFYPLAKTSGTASFKLAFSDTYI